MVQRDSFDSSRRSGDVSHVGSGWRIRDFQSIKRRRNRICKHTGVPFFQQHAMRHNTWIAAPLAFRSDTKAFLQSKQIKALREGMTHQHRHTGRAASHNAASQGKISDDTLAHDESAHRPADRARHRTTPNQQRWAALELLNQQDRKPWADTWDDESFGDNAASQVDLEFLGDTAATSYDELFPALGDTADLATSSKDHHKGVYKDRDTDLEDIMPTETCSATNAVVELDDPTADLDARQEKAALIAANKELCEKIVNLEAEMYKLHSHCSHLEGMLYYYNWNAHGCNDGFSPLVQLEECHPAGRDQPSMWSTAQHEISMFYPSTGKREICDQPSMQPTAHHKDTPPAIHDSSPPEHFALRKDLLELREDLLGNGNSSLTSLREQLASLELRIDSNLRWQRTENQIALEEQQRLDNGLAALTERVAGLEKLSSTQLGSIKSELQNDANKLWQLRLQSVSDVFQGRLDELQCKLEALDRPLEANDAFEEQFETCLKTHLFDARLLELSKKLQECRCRMHSFGEECIPSLHSAVESLKEELVALQRRVLNSQGGDQQKEGVCSQHQSGTGSELRIGKPLRSPSGDHLQRSSGSMGLKRIDSSDGNDECTIPPQRSVAELQAIFERLQGREKSDDQLPLVPKVDMGIYISNSIMREEVADLPFGEEKKSKRSFKQRRSLAHLARESESSTFSHRQCYDGLNFSDSEDGLSSHTTTESQAFARRILEEGYNPYEFDHENLCDSPLRTDEEQGFDSHTDEEPWS